MRGITIVSFSSTEYFITFSSGLPSARFTLKAVEPLANVHGYRCGADDAWRRLKMMRGGD
jgi:hypothetical protein